MNLTYEISNLAQRDLEDIWLYTFENWSLSQADKYYKSIIKEIDKICRDPEIGFPIDYVKLGHRTIPIKSHIIVYKIQSNKIWIDRIFYKNMDLEARLSY